MLTVQLDTGPVTVAAGYLTSDGHLVALDRQGDYAQGLLDTARLLPEGLSWLVALEPDSGELVVALVHAGRVELLGPVAEPGLPFRLGFERGAVHLTGRGTDPLARLGEGGWKACAPAPVGVGALLIGDPDYVRAFAGRKLSSAQPPPPGPRQRLSPLAI